MTLGGRRRRRRRCASSIAAADASRQSLSRARRPSSVRASRACAASSPRRRSSSRDPRSSMRPTRERFGVGALPALARGGACTRSSRTTRPGAGFPRCCYDAYRERQARGDRGRRRASISPRRCRRYGDDLLSELLATAAAGCRARAPPRGRAAPPPARAPRARARRAAHGRGRRRRAARAVRAGGGHGPDRAHRPRRGAGRRGARRARRAPVRERTGAPFSSDGEAMHACGHDVHMAALVALARAAGAIADELPAPLIALFQPSEEAYPSGAEQLARGELATLAARRDRRGARAPGAPLGLRRARRRRRQRLLRRRRDRRRGRAVAWRLPAPRSRPDARACADRRRAARRS